MEADRAILIAYPIGIIITGYNRHRKSHLFEFLSDKIAKAIDVPVVVVPLGRDSILRFQLLRQGIVEVKMGRVTVDHYVIDCAFFVRDPKDLYACAPVCEVLSVHNFEALIRSSISTGS